MLKRKIVFISTKTRNEIGEEIHNLIRKERFYAGDTIFDLRIFFVLEIYSRNYKIEVSEIYKGTEIKVTGKTNPFVELTMWIAFIAFLYQFFKVIFSEETIDYVDLYMPLIWIILFGSIFFLPIKKELNLLKSKLS
jgi:hypothetical protein